MDDINIREEMTELINEHGYWAILRQAVPGTRCACVNPITNSADPRCDNCLSTGYAYIDRFAKVRKSRPIGITQMLGAEQRAAVRVMAPTDSIFYLEHYNMPTSQDFVLELAIDSTYQDPVRPYKVISVNDISDVREQRDREGRIEYYAVTAELKAWPAFDINQ